MTSINLSLLFASVVLFSGCGVRRVTVVAPAPQGMSQECWLENNGTLACSPKFLQALGPRHFLILSGQREGRTACEINVKPGAVLAILPDGSAELNQTDAQIQGCRFQWVNGIGPK